MQIRTRPGHRPDDDACHYAIVRLMTGAANEVGTLRGRGTLQLLMPRTGPTWTRADLRARPHSPFAGTGWLSGWRLTFGGEDPGWGALATISHRCSRESARRLVRVVALRPRLDHWESADTGVYNQIHVRVSTLDGDVLATHVLDAYEVACHRPDTWAHRRGRRKAGAPDKLHRGATSSSVSLARELSGRSRSAPRVLQGGHREMRHESHPDRQGPLVDVER